MTINGATPALTPHDRCENIKSQILALNAELKLWKKLDDSVRNRLGTLRDGPRRQEWLLREREQLDLWLQSNPEMN